MLAGSIAPVTDITMLTKKFTDYFIPTVNVRYERGRLHERVQGNETIENFLRELYFIVRTCGYDREDHMILNKLYKG